MARSRKARRGARAATVPAKDVNLPVAAVKPASATPVRAPAASGIGRTLRLSLAIIDPTTWFPPIWAFLCGAAASGHLGDGADALVHTLLGLILAGPVLLGFAHVVTYYAERGASVPRATDDNHGASATEHMPRTRVILTGTILLALGFALAFSLGETVAILAAAGAFLGVAYSLPPLSLERYGWLSSGMRSLGFVGLPWLAGTATLSAAPLPPISVILAALFTLGAYGAATVTDFTSIEHDRARGIRTVPMMVGTRDAAVVCCTLIDLAQVVVVELAVVLGAPLIGVALALLLLAQWFAQRMWIAQPEAKARWFLNTGVLLAMVAMIVAAFGVVAPAMSR